MPLKNSSSASPAQPASAPYDVENCFGINRATAGNVGQYKVPGTDISVRSGFNEYDFDFYRPDEALPVRPKEIIAYCMAAYDKFEMVKNVFDMMSDFVVKGIQVNHPVAAAETFGQEWFRRVDGAGVSERVTRMLLKAGNCTLYRRTAILPEKKLTVFRTYGQFLDKTGGWLDKVTPPKVKIRPKVVLKDGEIPYGYFIHDPRTVEIVGLALNTYETPLERQFGVRIVRDTYREMDILRNPIISESITPILSCQQSIVILPKEKTISLHYKKDDHQVWATPIVNSILTHLRTYDKLITADRAALEGAMSNIRLWTIGNLAERIFPNPAALAKLEDVLAATGNGGTMDLVWGPELSFTETSSKAYEFLGPEKYKPTLEAIFRGLGIPYTLAGHGGGESGFANNAVSFKVFTERMQFLRNILIKFWSDELDLLRVQFGWNDQFEIMFDNTNLSDESVLLKLFIDMWDRNIISDEYIQEKFGANPDIEAVRLRREDKRRDKGKLPPKAGPYTSENNYQRDAKKILLTQGSITPAEGGVDLDETKPGQISLVDRQAKFAQDAAKTQAVAPDKKQKTASRGRPPGTKDSGKRKPKVVTAGLAMWAEDTREQIAATLKPLYLKLKGKQNLRNLSVEEAAAFEDVCFTLMASFKPGDAVTEESLEEAANSTEAFPAQLDLAYAEAKASVGDISIEKDRRLQAAVYAQYIAESLSE